MFIHSFSAFSLQTIEGVRGTVEGKNEDDEGICLLRGCAVAKISLKIFMRILQDLN